MAKEQDQTGEYLGAYRLLRQLGRGSFGSVYLAQHIHEQRQVAVKRLQMTLNDKGAWKAFLNEARSFRLRHPYIMPLLDFGVTVDERPYLVMEYAPGGSVRSFVQSSGPLSLELIARYTLQMASALQYAHDRRLVHRDVKPENMLLRADGTLLLSDFGIAHLLDQSSLSGSLALAGTPAYMAPEQSMGRPCPASDQYALAVVVYEWLSGKRPFVGAPMEVAIQHRMDPPPSLSALSSAVTPQVEQVVLHALAKKPEERFTTIELFARALDAALLANRERDTYPEVNLTDHVSSTPLVEALEPASDTRLSNGGVVSSLASRAESVQQIPQTTRLPAVLGEQVPAMPDFVEPTQTPPSLPVERSRFARSRAVLLALLLLLLLGSVASAWIYQSHRSLQATTTPFAQADPGTASAQQTIGVGVTASASALQTATPASVPTVTPAATMPLSPTPQIAGVPSGWRQVVNDPMTTADSPKTWSQDASCVFHAAYYEERTSGSNYCSGGNSNNPADIFSTLFYAIDVAIQAGTEAGLIFRNTNNAYYYFAITTTGHYALEWHSPVDGGQDQIIVSGTSSAILQGKGQWNVLTVLAQGSTFKLYINTLLVTSATDTTYTQGTIAVGVNGPNSQGVTGDAWFKNAVVWVP
jgi:serine/threonine protein kinase